jgi:hypothetical protein
MTNNIRLGPDANANQMLRVLQAENPVGDIICDQPIVPGILFSFDSKATMKGALLEDDAAVLSFRIESLKNSAWLALHVSLGGFDLDGYDIIGFICKSHAPAAISMKACIRSGTEAGFIDCFFDKHVVSYAKPSTHLDALDITTRKALPAQALWRDFVLFLPPDRPVEATLQDLRLFIV